MHDPDCQIFRFGPITIWHHDPCRDHTDDSCGIFMRSRHGSKEVLKKIVSDFEFEWDREYKPSKEDHDDEDGEFVEQTYYRGLFKPNGDPLFSVHGIVLNLLFHAAYRHFGNNREKTVKYLQSNLFEILMFAENPIDSLRDSIMRTFAKGCGEEYTAHNRMERIEGMASAIYGFVLRGTRPWYRHPKWHIHHWRFTVRMPQMFVKARL